MVFSDVVGAQRLPVHVEEQDRRERGCSLGDCFGRLWTWFTAPHAPEKAGKTAAKVEKLADELDVLPDDDLLDPFGINQNVTDQDSLDELGENQLFLHQVDDQLLQMQINSLDFQTHCLTLVKRTNALIQALEEEINHS